MQGKFKMQAAEAISDCGGALPAGDIAYLSSLISPLRGNVRLETHDPLTGKMLDLCEGHNFISVDCIALLKRLQKLYFAQNNPVMYMQQVSLTPNDNQDMDIDGAFKWLYLSDSTNAESPTTETGIPGNIVGYANRLPYSGTDIMRGAINQNESYANDDKCRWVWDFATDRANGTIGSVGLCRAIVPSPFSLENITPSSMTEMNMSLLFEATTRAYTNVQYSGGYFWALYGATIYKLDPSTFAELASYPLPFTPDNPWSWAVSGDYIYYSYNGYIYRYQISTGTNTENWGNCGGTPGIIVVSGNYLYVLSTLSSVITQIPIATPASYTYKELTLPSGFDAFKQFFGLINNKLYVGISKSGLPTSVLNNAGYAAIKYDYASNAFDATDMLPYIGNNITDDGSTNWYWGSVVTQTGYYNSASNNYPCFYKTAMSDGIHCRNMMTRKLLSTPITKPSVAPLKTLKVVYDISYA